MPIVWEFNFRQIRQGGYLRAWDLSQQKPVRRAYERSDVAIGRWLKRKYPTIAWQARRDKAAISWSDEMGLCSDHVTGTGDASVGRTPVMPATGQRFGCNMTSAIINKGVLVFMVFEGQLTAPEFVVFMQRLLKQVAGRIYLIMDGHPAHKSGKATLFVGNHSSRLRLIWTPDYGSELNPDEWLNQDVKTRGRGRSQLTNRTQRRAIVRSHVYRRQTHKNLVREKPVRYAA
jgi:transposase